MKKADKPRKVYIVTSGDYSDYRIEGVYATRRAAKLHCETTMGANWTSPRIETWTLDLYADRLARGYKHWSVVFLPSGGAEVPQLCTYELSERIERWAENVSVYLWAKDAEHALKIATDRYFEWKAKKERIA